MTLRVILEIVPFGEEDKKYQIGNLDISNFGNDTPGVCSYKFKLDSPHYSDKIITHKRNDGAWKLVQKVLNEL